MLTVTKIDAAKIVRKFLQLKRKADGLDFHLEPINDNEFQLSGKPNSEEIRFESLEHVEGYLFGFEASESNARLRREKEKR